ncbi:hypothetical protein Lal_00013341 [Lupinus albus]|nr:hypothetical protein Lal_00013341 [Lupinus albus]
MGWRSENRATLSPPFFLCICFGLICSYVVADDGQSNVGFGYTISNVNNDSSGQSLTANLNLIKSSSVFGDDIKHLTLNAR